MEISTRTNLNVLLTKCERWRKSVYLLLGIMLLTLQLFAQTVPNEGLSFNGTSQYMVITNHADFNFTNAQSFSISGWVNISNTSYTQIVSTRQGGNGYDFAQELNKLTNDFGNPYLRTQQSANGFTSNTWHHVGYVYNGTTKKVILYLNGVAVVLNATGTFHPQTAVTTQENTYGNKIAVFAKAANTMATPTANPSGGFTTGKISTLRFWNKALDATEMDADKSATVTASTPNLIAAYDFAKREQQGMDLIIPDIKGNHPGILKGFTVDILPVTLVHFTVKTENNTAKLAWATSSENNNKGFVVYRSGDDRVFVKIDEVSGSGNSSTEKTYQYYDRKPLNGNNYYKLVQVDNDGKETDLGVRPLVFSLSSLGLSLYPNPTKDKVTITFSAGKYRSLAVVDVSGKTLKTFNINPEDYSLVVGLNAYQAGIYLLKLTGEKDTEVKRVVKQ